MLFSLIVATYGRSHELGRLLGSLAKQELDKFDFQVIVVDQNESIDLSPVIERYRQVLQLMHVRSSRKGLSYNRNLGLQAATGKYVCFPDDDCIYYPDTLKNALIHLEKDGVESVFGAIRDRNTGRDIIRKWPKKTQELSRRNFFRLYSSITIFTSKNKLLFNEDLGVGCYFGSYEDADYSYRLVAGVGKSKYFADVEVWHPEIGIRQFSKEKNKSYGLGFGAFCYLHKSDIYILLIFILSVIYHLYRCVLSLLFGKRSLSGSHFDSFIYRLKGFSEFRKNTKFGRRV